MYNPVREVRSWLDQRRLRAELRSMAALGAGAVPSAPVLSGTFVTPETAIGLTAVYCALNVISGDVACLPRHVYKTLDGGGQEIERGHPAEWLVGSGDPNEDMGSFRYLQTEMGHTLGRGNGFSEIVRSGGYPTSLEPLHPVKTRPKRTKGGKLYYELDNKHTLAAEDVLHFAGLGFDGVSGYCPITLCRQSLGVTIATEQHGAAFFGNGAVMGGVLKHPRRLGEAAMSNLRKTINQVHQGTQSAYNLLILEEGMEYAERGISPEDSQFIQGREFGVLEVARMFRCPPHKLGDYSQAHLANVEESNLDYLATTILTWVCMIDDEGTRKLLTRQERMAGLRILTDLRALLRGNTAARTTYYQTMRNMGTMSADDIRISEGMNPLPAGSGGDLYLVQAQYQPLSKAGEPKPEPAPPPGSPPAPGSEPPAQSPSPAKKGKPKPARSERRFNENHDEKGLFAEGEGDGGGGSPESHPDVVDLKEAHADQVKEYQADHAQAQKDLAKDQTSEVKDLAKEQAREVKQQEREQAKEVKDLARDQEKERTALEKDPEATHQDKADLLDEHKEGQAGMAHDHEEGRANLAEQHANEQKDLAEQHTEQKAELERDHQETMTQLARDQADEVNELVTTLKEEDSDE